MIGPAPDFVNSKYFVSEPDWHLEDGASEKEKKDLERFMNTEEYRSVLKELHPGMKNPWYCWDGEVREKK